MQQRRCTFRHVLGVAWTGVPAPSPDPSGFYLWNSLALASDNVWASGWGREHTFTLHWDGARWSSVPTPDRYESLSLVGIAGTVADRMWAVDMFQDPYGAYLALPHSDGRTWETVPDSTIRLRDILHGVAASAGDDIWTVGYSGLVLRWNGQSWQQAQPASGPDTGLYSVAMIAPDEIWAVGRDRNGAHIERDTYLRCP